MQKIIWNVHYNSTLPVTRHCKKCCRNTKFVSSGLFRVNAQRKDIDIWLIYRCCHCNTTWNVTVFSRINPKSIDLELLERFTNNDEVLANQYAMDVETLRRNGGEIGLPDYTIIGDDIPHNEMVELQIKSDFISQIKVSTIIREKLKLSQKKFEEMILAGKIKGLTTQELKKCKLLGGIVLHIVMV